MAGLSAMLQAEIKIGGTNIIDYTKAFECVDHDKLWKALREMGIPDHRICLLRNLMGVKKQQLEPCMEQMIGSRSRKEQDRAVCLSSCLFNL